MRAGSNTFTIPYDRQGLADYLNADRSALSNELSKLQKEGVLSYKKNTFSLRV
jgi:CRP-like cAMP-binding protein